MKKAAPTIAVILAAAVPGVALAQTSSVSNLRDLASLAVYYFNIAIELIIGLAILTFIFNIYRYFFTNKENKERGMYLLWSIVGFFVILAFWGLVNLVANTFNFNTSAPTNFTNVFGGGTSYQSSAPSLF